MRDTSSINAATEEHPGTPAAEQHLTPTAQDGNEPKRPRYEKWRAPKGVRKHQKKLIEIIRR